jgi:hypothetical protein
MEGIKRIIIESEIKEDGRLHLNFNKFKEDTYPSRFELLAIMVSGLVMTTKIACEELDYETQGKLLKDVFDNLKKDLFDGDSFKDLDIRLEEL